MGDQIKVPDGWKVETRVRKTGRKDRYYVDPAKGYIFRSLKDIDRYLLTGKLGRHVTKTKPQDFDNSSDMKLDVDPVPLKQKGPRKTKSLKSVARKKPRPAAEGQSSAGNAHKREDHKAPNAAAQGQSSAGNAPKRADHKAPISPAQGQNSDANAPKQEDHKAQNSAAQGQNSARNAQKQEDHKAQNSAVQGHNSARNAQKREDHKAQNSAAQGQNSAGNAPKQEDHKAQNSAAQGQNSAGNAPKQEDHKAQNSAAHGQNSAGNAPKQEDHKAQNSAAQVQNSAGNAPKQEDHKVQNSAAQEKNSAGNTPKRGDHKAQDSKETAKKKSSNTPARQRPSRPSKGRKKESTPFFILDQDQCEEENTADIPNLSEIIDSIQKLKEGGNAVYVSAPSIGALLGEKLSESVAKQENSKKPQFAPSIFAPSMFAPSSFNNSLKPSFPSLASKSITNPFQDMWIDTKSKAKEELGSNLFGDLLTDPCIDFAIKTLTGGISLSSEQVLGDRYLQQQVGSSMIRTRK